MIRFDGADKLFDEQKRALLSSMINRGERGWLQDGLRNLEVVGRARIYKDFGWVQYNADTQNIQRVRDAHIGTILEQTEIESWISLFLTWYTVPTFRQVLNAALTKGGSVNRFAITYEDA